MWSARRAGFHRASSSVFAATLALGLIAALARSSASTAAAEGQCEGRTVQTVEATTLNARLASGEAVFLSCVRVAGRIELRPDAGEVGPFFLIESTVEGGITAPFVRFGGPVHFDGSCFLGDVDVTGAVFADEVNWARADFACGERPVGLSAAAARFHGPADLRVEGFGVADFSDASFSARALFQGTKFLGETTFRGALFEGDTSYRGSVFLAFSDFENVVALADVDFSRAAFLDDARFRRLAGAGRVSLRDVRFRGDLTLDNASLATADFGRGEVDGALYIDDFSAGSLTMPPRLVERIEDGEIRMAVLRLIERSAKAAGDTGLANNAFFQRQALVTRDKPQPRQTLWLGVELVTGYLVRPMRPLLAIGVVALLGLAVRLAIHSRELVVSVRQATQRRRRGRPQTPADAEARSRSSWHIVALIAAPAGRALNAALNPKPPKPEIDELNGATYVIASLVWLEYLVQKLLVVVFLLSLGNANPTIREIVTSVV